MRNRESNNSWKAAVRKEKIFGSVILIAFLAFIVYAGYKIYKMEQRYNALQRDISLVNLHTERENQSEYTQTIDFLENEMTKFRDFTEKQQNFLISLIGTLGVGVTAVLTFLGIQNRKNISQIINESYQDCVQQEMAALIGGPKKLRYLEDGINKEERAKNKTILFVWQSEKNAAMQRIYRILKGQKYLVKKYCVSGEISDKKVEAWAENFDIIVYQLAQSEDRRENSGDSNKMYMQIAGQCEKKQVYCVAFCQNGIQADSKFLQDVFYTSTANYGLTLLERIYNLLYFVREEDTDEV